MQNTISKTNNFYIKHKNFFYFGVFVLILLLIVVINKKDDTGVISGFVDKGDVSSNLLLSGRVESVNFVDLRFVNSGLVQNIFVKEGDEVTQGQKIAELSTGALFADLKDAQANLILRNSSANTTIANTTIAEQNLIKTTEQQNLLVLNAFRGLLNNDLRAYPKDLSLDYQVTPPTVSGSYIGDIEGYYEIEIYSSSSSSGVSFRYKSNIEEDGVETINQYTPSKLGNKGLYLNFKEGDSYANTKWVIEIPNKRSSTYFSSLSFYNESKKNRDIAIANAEDGFTRAKILQGGQNQDVTNAEILQARARIDRINSQIKDSTLIAPFDGVVSKINIKSGEIANANTSAISIISPSGFQIRLEVPEVDLAKVKELADVNIELDAFPGVFLEGYVSYIAPAEILVNGVSVYEALVNFKEIDDRVRSGMSARALIKEDFKEDVLFVKKQFIEKDELGDYVFVKKGDDLIKTYIKTGIYGSNGNVEVITGLSFGDILIINTK